MEWVYQYEYTGGKGNIWDNFDGRKIGTFRNGGFAYPANSEVVDTVQWEGWREAVDDIRYLTTLLKELKKRKNYNPQRVLEIEEWLKKIGEKDDLQKIRYEIAHKIIELSNDKGK